MPRERIKRKKKDKEWYNVLAPHMFGKAKIAETIADDPEKITGRNVDISLQELTNDFAKSHIKLRFKIVDTRGLEANTVFIGHSLTSDYIKRMSRKHKSKVDGVFDIRTRDGVRVRIKPSALASKRIQTSQKRAIRAILKETMRKEAVAHDFNGFVKLMLDGELGKEAYRLSKKIYPIKRVEVYKSEVMEIPKVKAIADKDEETGEEIEEAAPVIEETEDITPKNEEAGAEMPAEQEEGETKETGENAEADAGEITEEDAEGIEEVTPENAEEETVAESETGGEAKGADDTEKKEEKE